jgi:nicotinamidase-related amidase
MIERLLLGIDLQEGFLHDEARKDRYVERVEDFLDQHKDEWIVLSKFINQPGNNFEKLINYTSLDKNDPKARLIGNLESLHFETIEKDTYSAWHSPLTERVAEKGIKKVVIFGLDTEACVLKTALDIFDAGIEPVVLEDLCYSSNGEHGHTAGINLLKVLIGLNQIKTSALF